MKCLCFLLLLSPMAWGQGFFVAPQQTLKVVNGIMFPAPLATVTVCAANTSGIPCAPALVGAVFKDAALTQPLSNPFNADANGNYQFAIAPGQYTVTTTAAGFNGYSYQITVHTNGGGGGGSGTVSSNNGSAGAIAFYAAAGGSTTVGPDSALTDSGTTLAYSGGGSTFNGDVQASSNAACNSGMGFNFLQSTNSGINFAGARVNICQTGAAVASFNAGLGVGNGNILFGNAAPTISSGFGTSPSIVNNNGTASFTVNVGTGGTAQTGTIGLPVAAHGWGCYCNDLTTNNATQFVCKQTGAGTTNTAPIGEFTAAGAATNWLASDVLHVTCSGY